MTGLHPLRARTVVVVVGLAVLAVLEIADGFRRVDVVRRARRRELLDMVEERQENLVAEVSELIGDGKRHAIHLARHPYVRALLEAGSDERVRRDLGLVLQPYLASFAEIDRLTLLDGSGRELFRCARMGGGVATLPMELLDERRHQDLTALAFASPAGNVAVSPLAYDEERVEVEESDRRVFHLAAAVGDREAPHGAVVVTVYATPLLQALRRFVPLPETATCLLDDDGRIFAPGEEAEARATCEGHLASRGDSRARVVAGERRVPVPEAVLLARRTGVEPASFLLSSVPESSLVPDLSAGETLRAGLRTFLVLGGIGVAAALFVSANQRAARLAEIERYAARVRQESEKHRALMEAAADMILIVEPETQSVEDANPQARERLGVERSAGDLREWLEPLGDEGRERLLDGVRAAAEPGREPVVVGGLGLRVDDERRELEARCVGLDYGGARRVELLFADRTRELEMERIARTGERLSALGMLTAGVAHEINNPLEGIANYLALAERATTDEERERHLAQVKRGFERIREITGDLLPLARPVEPGGAADLRRVVERSISMGRYSKELRDVEVQVEGFDRPLAVGGSEGGLEQVVLNLLLNAGRAVDGRGRVSCRARVLDDARVELAVEDEGPGIAPEDLERVFDPFFTKSGGTGLGLSVSYQIARAFGGDLSAANRAGGGARFALNLPLHTESGEETSS